MHPCCSLSNLKHSHIQGAAGRFEKHMFSLYDLIMVQVKGGCSKKPMAVLNKKQHHQNPWHKLMLMGIHAGRLVIQAVEAFP